MKSVLTRLAVASAAMFLSVLPANALDFPKKAYDATYNYSAPTGTHTMRMVSDGKGKMRTETNTGGMKVVVITDYLKEKSTTLLENQKKYMVQSIAGQPGSVYDDTTAKKNKAESLGTKVVNGHPSKGWKYNVSGSNTEVWIGNDTQCVVQSVTDSKVGKMTMKLTSYKAGAPAAAAFEIPSGYTELSMGR